MTNRTEYPSIQHHPTDATPAARRSSAGWSVRRASITAGVALLLMSAVAIFGNFVAVDGLVTEGNAAQTAQDIRASEGLFRLGIVSMVVVIALDVVIAWALYRVFSPVNKSVSMLAAALRLVYSGVFMVAIAQLVGVARLLSNDTNTAVFGADQVNAQALLGVLAYKDIWYVSQFLFGLHLLVIGYLAYRSGYVPRLLGALLAIAGLGYAADSIGTILSSGSWTDISSFTFLGEFLLALWLVIRARRIAVSASVLDNEPITIAA
jgi:hypothetical protein